MRRITKAGKAAMLKAFGFYIPPHVMERFAKKWIKQTHKEFNLPVPYLEGGRKNA